MTGERSKIDREFRSLLSFDRVFECAARNDEHRSMFETKRRGRGRGKKERTMKASEYVKVLRYLSFCSASKNMLVTVDLPYCSRAIDTM